jgi:hypothetical protein
MTARFTDKEWAEFIKKNNLDNNGKPLPPKPPKSPKNKRKLTQPSAEQIRFSPEEEMRIKLYEQEYGMNKMAIAQAKAEQRQKNRDEMLRAIPGTNYQAKNYIRPSIKWTASQVIRKPYSPGGTRMEFVSRGYTGPSGFPELWNRWDDTTGTTTLGRVKGNLSIGSRKTTKSGLTPTIVPNLGFILNAPVGSKLGKGDVIMPVVGMLKFKKRGGRFQRNDFWM